MNQPSSCKTCTHRTRMDSCAVPVAAGLSDKFAIRWHERGGVGCGAYVERTLRTGRVVIKIGREWFAAPVWVEARI